MFPIPALRRKAPALPDVALGHSDAKIRFVWSTDEHKNYAALGLAADDCTSWAPNAYISTGDLGDDLAPGVKASIAALRRARRPDYLIIGNHDEEEETYGAGTPNTAAIEVATAFNMSAPFYHTWTMTSGDGTLIARCFALDCNFYGGGSPSSPDHSVGDRIGSHSGAPAGGYKRQLGATQTTWVETTLAADATSDIILVFMHYPVNTSSVLDESTLDAKLDADGRPTVGFCGHTHPNGELYTLGGTYTFYKCPAMKESNSWTRVTLSESGGAIVIDEMLVKNYTTPGAWTLTAPFTT